MSDPAGVSREIDHDIASGSQGMPLRTDPPAKTPEQMAADEIKFSSPLCPCENEEPEPMSEYDVPGEWVTYTGAINHKFFEFAAYHAANAKLEEADRTEISEQSSAAVPSFDLTAPSAPLFEDGTATVAEATTSAGEEPAGAEKDTATALTTVRIHEKAVLGKIPADSVPECFYDSDNELLDDWAVCEAADDARKAAARSQQAAYDAGQDNEAAKVAQEAICAQAKAVRVALKFTQAKNAAFRAQAIQQARAADEVAKKK